MRGSQAGAWEPDRRPELGNQMELDGRLLWLPSSSLVTLYSKSSSFSGIHTDYLSRSWSFLNGTFPSKELGNEVNSISNCGFRIANFY